MIQLPVCSARSGHEDSPTGSPQLYSAKSPTCCCARMFWTRYVIRMFHTKPSDLDFRRLVEECRNLPSAKGNYLVDDFMENLFRTVLDFQMRVTTVERAVDYYHEHVQMEIADFAALKNLLAKYPDTKPGNLQIAQYLWGYKHWTRVELLRRFVAYFEERDVTTQEKLKQWASEVQFDRDFKGKIKGAGIAIFQWLIMRQGVETVKPDMWVHRFIQDVLGFSVSDEMAIKLLESVAQEIELKAYELDWRIWEKQTGRS